MLNDLQSALRQLLRKPGVAVVAVLSLALGTGATAAVFACLDGFYMRPLPVPHSGQLVRIFGATDQQAYDENSYQEYRAVRAQSGALASLGAAQRRGANLLVRGEPRGVLIYMVSPDFFQMLGVQPGLGRLFGPGEEQAPVVVFGVRLLAAAVRRRSGQLGGGPSGCRAGSSATLRTREIGIRMAIGARRADAARLVVRHALSCAGLGIAVGIPASMAVMHALRSMLFGISPWYAPAFVGGEGRPDDGAAVRVKKKVSDTFFFG